MLMFRSLYGVIGKLLLDHNWNILISWNLVCETQENILFRQQTIE
uniref:Uncharacterized protein n=1 Tax=Megaselia scalaris TaxID=36166 RepID=T1GF34_MEGSC